MDAPVHPLVAMANQRLGRTVLGKWTLEEVRGVGGMATVYAARHRNGVRVALKMLHPQVSASTELRQRFAREAYLSNLVAHPAAVRVLDDDVDDVDGCAFLVMDLVEGVPLDDPRFAPFDDARLLDVAEQVLEVLVAAHERGVVHRDLKPENLLVQSDGRVRVLDFGIARALDDDRDPRLTRDGTTCGTPEFVAPEQAMGRRALVSGKTDVYALGATLFHLAAGEPVHGHGTPQELVIRAAHEPARSLRAMNVRLDARTIEIVDAALQLQIEARPTDQALLREVRAARAALCTDRHTLSHAPPEIAPAVVTSMPRRSTFRTFVGAAARRSFRVALVAATVAVIASGLQLVRARRSTTHLEKNATVLAAPHAPQPASLTPRPAAPMTTVKTTTLHVAPTTTATTRPTPKTHPMRKHGRAKEKIDVGY